MPKAVDNKGQGGPKNQPSGTSGGMGTHADSSKGSDKSILNDAAQAPANTGIGNC